MGFWKWLNKVLRPMTYFDCILNKIIAGQYLYNGLFDDMIDLAIKNSTLHNETTTMSTISNLDRIIALDKYFSCQKFMKIVDGLDKVLTKNERLTKMLIKKANQLYNETNFGSASLCYNLALSYAPITSKYICEIYSQRSAMFLRTMDVELGLKDIQMALIQPNCSKKLLSKLKNQQIVCLNFINEYSNMTYNYNDGKNLQNQLYSKNIIFEIHGEQHSQIPCASNSIELLWSEDKGRHIVATQDLEPGVTVIVERPFVSALDNSLQWDMKHCFYCYKRVWRTVPCDTCVFAIYCDEICKTNDFENGHQYLCPCFPYLHGGVLDTYDHLAIKAICHAGPDNIYKLYCDSKSMEFNTKSSQVIHGFNPETKLYNSDSYYQIIHLISHIDNNNIKLNHFAWIGLSLAKILYYKTTFFQNIDESEKLSLQYFIGSLLLQHFISFPYNGIGLRKSKGINQRAYTKIRQRNNNEHSHGITAIYSLVSMMNHACEPTIYWQQSSDGKLAIITRQKIKAGDELYFSYGYNYTNSRKKFRQIEILKYYKFKCTCIACTNDWPLEENINSKQKYICPNCIQCNYSRNFLTKNCRLKRYHNNIICEKCENIFNIQTLGKQMNKIEKIFEKANDLIKKRNYIEAIPHILECISYYQYNISPPSTGLLISQDMLWFVYEQIIDI